VSVKLSLRPGHVYHYAVHAANSAGGEGLGDLIEDCPPSGSCLTPPQPTPCAEGCPGSNGPPYVTSLSREAEEAALRWAEGAPAREAERQAAKRREEEERAARRRALQEASEREGREQVERESALQARRVRCIVPDLKGDSLARARRALKKAHCSLGAVRGSRRGLRLVVRAQGTGAGRKLASGAAVAVTLGPLKARKLR
jgi:hypothetical protein